MLRGEMPDLEFLLVSALTALIISYVGTGAWIKIANNTRSFLAKDMNKYGEVYAARAGGLSSIIAISFGILIYEALQTYINGRPEWLTSLLAISLLLVLSGLLGFIDDILGWKKGLKPRYRILLMVPISLPLVVIKAGVSKLDIPIIGVVDFGVLYPLILVPVGVLGAANAFNMLAGYNGLEAGMGILLLAFTAVYAYSEGLGAVVLASIIGIAALIGFLVYNWYPAKTFPGNNFTYAVGAYYASLVILGNFEKFGITLFILYFLELILYLRGLKDGVYKQNFGIPQPDGSLKPPYGKVYSVTHLAIIILQKVNGKATERGVVVFILSLQILIGIISLIIYIQ